MKNSKLYELQPDPFDSSQKKHLRICLFTNVKNSSRLCEMLRAAEIDAAMIKPELVAEIFVLLAAANRAIHQAAHNRLYTRSLSAELVYSLSPTKHISESLKFFGISENSLNLLVATFGDADGKQMKFVAKQIDGITVPLENLGKLVDTSAIKKQLPVAFLGIVVAFFSYPSYVLWNIYEYTDKPVMNPFNEESFRILEERKKRREAGEFAVLETKMGSIWKDGVDKP